MKRQFVSVAKVFDNKNLGLVARILFLCLFLYTILIMAWVGDDIQITFRQVWNFITGYGITYNFSERVQAFTHPLWFFFLSSIVFVTRELFNTTIFVCIVLSMLSVLLLIKMEYDNKKCIKSVFSPIYLLLFSWAFCDYTTSGLENSLSYFLVGLLLYMFNSTVWRKNINYIFILLSLLVLNRLDYVVLFSPLAIILLFEIKTLRNFLSSVYIGVIIIFIWFLFATFYFGSPFPNTFYAKLNNNYSTIDVIKNGFDYFIALKVDLSTVLIIISSFIISSLSKNRILIALSIGQILYLSYILWSGGDFMQGRFFSILVFLSIGQMILALSKISVGEVTYNLMLFGLLFLAALIGLFSQHHVFSGPTIRPPVLYPFLSDPNYVAKAGYNSAWDERGGFYRTSGLLSARRKAWPAVMGQRNGLPTKYETICGLIGISALTDTSTYYIDVCGLTDPFLSRIPPMKTPFVLAGHLYRKTPTEYGEYVIGNIDQIPDTNLNELLSDVTITTKGDLFSLARLGAIWRLNTGHFSNIDFSEYETLETWVQRTTKIDKVSIRDWDTGIVPDKLPGRFNKNVKRFNGNLLIQSELADSAEGIWLYLDHSFKYDIHINGELTFPNINQKWYHCNGIVLDLLNTRVVDSVYLAEKGIVDFVASAINRIRFIKLLDKEEMKEVDPFDCKFDPYITRN